MLRENVESRAMNFRVPILRAAAFFAAVLTSSLANAQDVASEVKILRQTVAQQAKQIEALSAQIARLTEKIEGHANPAPAAERGAPAPAESTEFAIPAARAVPPHPPANVHIVVKGESLEKIAKSHGTTTTDLQKLNRITDPKKLQIGQQLQLPPPPPPPTKGQ
jgi:LysM repeat protein